VTGLRQDLRGLPRPLWFLYAGTFFNRFGSFVFTFLVLYLTKLGYSATEAGLAVSAYGAGHLASSAIGGYLTDRLGRRATIVISMYASAASMLALWQADSIASITVLTGVAGFAAELYRPASSALLSDLVPEKDRVTAFAMYRLAINAGFAAGPAVAGFLAASSFGWLFVGDALTSVIYGTVVLVAVPETKPRDAGVPPDSPRAMTVMLKDRAFMLFLGASLLTTWVYMQSTAGFPLHVQAQGLSTAVYGLLISINGVVVVLLELPFTSITKRLPARPVMAVGWILLGVGFALTGFATTVPALALTVVIWTIGEIVNAPVGSAYVASLAPVHLRGRYMGTWGLTWSAGLMLGPLLGARMFATDPWLLWGSCGILCAVAAGLVLLSPERRVEPIVPTEPGPAVPGVES
jgi:MFS family permease